MPLAPRYRLPATSTPRYPTGVDSVIGCDIAEHFDVQKEEKDFSEAQITQEEILIKINELFEEDVDTVGKWTARYNYFLRKTLHIGRADVKDSIYKDHTLDVWYERYVREGKLKEKLLEIRRVILRNTMTDIHRETLIPMLIIAVFMNARYGSSNPNFPAVRREVLFNIFDREVMKTPMYASLKALFEVQLDEYHDICPIDQEGNIVLYVPHDAHGNPQRPGEVNVSTGRGVTPSTIEAHGVEAVISGGQLVGADRLPPTPTGPTPHTHYQVYTAHGNKMMNGASNEILKAEFEKGKTVQIADIQISEIEEEEVHKTSFSGLIRKSVTTPKYYKTIRYYATDGNVYVQKDEYDLVPATATTPASHIPKTNMLGTQIRGKITLEHAFDNHRCRFLRVEGKETDYSKDDLKLIGKHSGVRTYLRTKGSLYKAIVKDAAKKSRGKTTFRDMVRRYNDAHGSLAIPRYGSMSILSAENRLLSNEMILNIGKELSIFTDERWDTITGDKHKIRNTLVAEIITSGRQHDFLEVYNNTLISGMDEMLVR